MSSLDRECDVFCRALIGRPAPQPIRDSYRRAHEVSAVGAPDSAFDAWLAAFAGRGPRRTRLADSYAVLFARGGLLRRKLVFLLAILESYAETSRSVDTPRSRSAAEFFARAALSGVAFVLYASVAVVLFLGPRLALSRERPRA